jgi:hypothetical protein
MGCSYHCDGQNNGHGYEKREGQKKPPYKCSACEEAHHVNEERSRSRSHSGGSNEEDGFHNSRSPKNGKANGRIDYDESKEDMDDRSQDQHKSFIQGGYCTFNAPKSCGKR